MMQLRPYQAQAKDAVLSEWNKGYRKTLLVLPTGTGKTVVFSKVVENQVSQGGRALILAHRGELLTQAADKLRAACGMECALEKAEFTSLGSPLRITVGSVQSLAQPKRLERFPHDYFTDIVVDEAHHCLSDSYQRVLEHFPDANILGVTATPDRGDMKNLGQYFDSKAFEYTMQQAIKEKYLCPIKAQMIPLELDISGVKVSNGDFSSGEIGNALEPYLEQIAREMVRYCDGRKTVVFLPLVHISQRFTEILNSYGFRAAEVNGNSTDREEVLRDFENGRYDVLCNSMLLTEGWDCPAVDCVVVLRPTKVRSLYQQMVGRGMRLYPGKDHLLLLDFLWLSERHDLCRPSALVSKDAEILNSYGFRAAEVNGNSTDREEVLRDFENGRYDVLCNSMLLTEGWDCPAVDCVVVLRPTKVRSLYQQMVGRGMRLHPGKDHLLLLDFLWLSERHDLCRPSALVSKDAEIAKKIDAQLQNSDEEFDLIDAEEQAERDVLAEREEALAKELAEMRKRKRKLVDPIQFAVSIAAEDLVDYVPTFAWEMAPPSPRQIEFLEKRGIFAETVGNVGKASLLIDRLVRRQDAGLSTPKQIRCLERYGFRQVGTWQFDDAAKMISRLAANNWRIPYGLNPRQYRP